MDMSVIVRVVMRRVSVAVSLIVVVVLRMLVIRFVIVLVHRNQPISSIVIVRVMQVRGVRVRMLDRIMMVRMAMGALGHRVVTMQMVSVVVAVGMFVVERLVSVDVRMDLQGMQDHAAGHEHESGCKPGTQIALAKRERNRSTNERRGGEDRSGARCAERSLSKKIESQAQAVPECTAHKQSERDSRTGKRVTDQQRDSTGKYGRKAAFSKHHRAGVGIGKWA